MNREDEFLSPRPRKRALPKYNKLSKEQKLLIIKEWDRTHLSYASISEKFSALWGIKLSKRGVGDLVKYWRESGKIRGYSDSDTAAAEFANTFKTLCSLCQKNGYPISESELKQIYNWNMWMSGNSREDDQSYLYSTTIKSLVEQVACNLELSDPANDLATILTLSSDYPPSAIFCVDFFFFLPKLLPSTEQPYVPSQCTSFTVWNAVSLSGAFPFHPTSETSLVALLQSLDDSAVSPTLVLLHCIEPVFLAVSGEKSGQSVTFGTSFSPSTSRSLRLRGGEDGDIPPPPHRPAVSRERVRPAPHVPRPVAAVQTVREVRSVVLS